MSIITEKDILTTLYEIKDYGNPHIDPSIFDLPENTVLSFINEIKERYPHKALHTTISPEILSFVYPLLVKYGFFHYYTKVNGRSVWIITNNSGIPLASTHTFGSRGVPYYISNGEFYFLMVVDRFGPKSFMFPGGYVQPEDSDIVETMEKRIKDVMSYRNPEDVAISEVLEETGFDIRQFGSKPILVGKMYTEDTKPDRGALSPNDACDVYAFQVTENNQILKEQSNEILAVQWVNSKDALSGSIPHDAYKTATEISKLVVERIVQSHEAMEAFNNKDYEKYSSMVPSLGMKTVPIRKSKFTLLNILHSL